mgnify:CR=1 FL=1
MEEVLGGRQLAGSRLTLDSEETYRAFKLHVTQA